MPRHPSPPHAGRKVRNVLALSYARGVEFLVVGFVCAAGLVIPIALGLADPRRRRPRGR